MIIRICSKCNNKGEGKFCSECGGMLTTVNRCVQCKQKVGIGDRYCSECGAKMDEPEVRIPQIRATIHL